MCYSETAPLICEYYVAHRSQTQTQLVSIQTYKSIKVTTHPGSLVTLETSKNFNLFFSFGFQFLFVSQFSTNSPNRCSLQTSTLR